MVALGVVYSDASLIVGDKPAGVLSAPGRGAQTFPELLAAAGVIESADACFLVHRLDRDASGVICYARSVEAQRALTSQFEARMVEKTYVTIVRGVVAGDGEVDLPIAADAGGSSARIDQAEGKPSVTRYRVVDRLAGFTVLHCYPLTGRLHQIRVHMAAIGHPLAVDPVYARTRELRLSQLKRGYRPGRGEERPLISRLTLHALRLELDHPESGARVSFEAPPPKDLRATMTQLAKL